MSDHSCPKCHSRVMRDVAYRSFESGELIEYKSCTNCAAIIFPDSAETEVPAQPVRDFNLAKYCRENYAALETRKETETYQQLCDWVKKKFGCTFTQQTFATAMATAKKSQKQPSSKKPEVATIIHADMPELLKLVAAKVSYAAICRMKNYPIKGDSLAYHVKRALVS